VNNQHMRVNTILISDIHLGSDLARPRDLINTLRAHLYDQLVIIGDLFDDMNLERLNSDHFELINYLREIGTHSKVVWVEGNHDYKMIKRYSEIIGTTETCERYVWNYMGKKYLAIHGHQFDEYLLNHGKLTGAACAIYRISQRFDTRLKTNLSRRLRKGVERWKNITERVLLGAIKFAEFCGVDSVFCGHTHNPVGRFNQDHIEYWNTGCWTDPHVASYVTIDEKGPSLKVIK
jgi:UDP-2,3-diacylglucosamine pyrophosphatase LpxH